MTIHTNGRHLFFLSSPFAHILDLLRAYANYLLLSFGYLIFSSHITHIRDHKIPQQQQQHQKQKKRKRRAMYVTARPDSRHTNGITFDFLLRRYSQSMTKRRHTIIWSNADFGRRVHTKRNEKKKSISRNIRAKWMPFTF